MLGTKPSLASAYHSPTSAQTERFKKAIVQPLRHYVEEHQEDWDLYLSSLTYAYNLQFSRQVQRLCFILSLQVIRPAR